MFELHLLLKISDRYVTEARIRTESAFLIAVIAAGLRLAHKV
jgi:hypothetical protein